MCRPEVALAGSSIREAAVEPAAASGRAPESERIRLIGSLSKYGPSATAQTLRRSIITAKRKATSGERPVSNAAKSGVDSGKGRAATVLTTASTSVALPPPTAFELIDDDMTLREIQTALEMSRLEDDDRRGVSMDRVDPVSPWERSSTVRISPRSLNDRY